MYAGCVWLTSNAGARWGAQAALAAIALLAIAVIALERRLESRKA